MIDGDQAWLLARSLEEWGRQVLIRDRQQSADDTLGEDWAFGLPPTTVNNGVVSGQIEDLQGRLNINTLVDIDPKTAELAAWRMSRLFSLCEIEDDLIPALIDWLDGDSDTRPGGAEDDAYQLRDPPSRAGNQKMFTPSELLQLDGIDPGQYACLAPNLTALPESTKVNINTAPALVIRALAEDLSAEAAEEVINDRAGSGYKNVAEFMAHPALVDAKLDARDLDLSSNFFLIMGQADFGHGQVDLYSVIDRRSGDIKVISRSIGAY